VITLISIKQDNIDLISLVAAKFQKLGTYYDEE
jgi:hypothetical protein